MATVWIFFAGGKTDTVGAGAGAMGADIAGPGIPVVITPGGPAFGAGKIGMVETTRGAAFAGAGTSTGFSSRETSFSPEPALFAPAWPDVLACELPALGTILFGPSSALMIGGSDGSIEPPNMAR